MATKKKSPIVVKLRTRLAFPAIFRPQVDADTGRQTYGASFILESADEHFAEQIAAVEKAMQTAAKIKWGEKGDAMLKQLRTKDRLALHDGDGKAEYAGFEGNMFVSARNTSKPGVFDNRRDPDTGLPVILTEDDARLYSGCYVVAKIEFYAQDSQEYGKRINGSLQGLMFAGDGERFAGGEVSKADDFEDMLDDEDQAEQDLF